MLDFTYRMDVFVNKAGLNVRVSRVLFINSNYILINVICYSVLCVANYLYNLID